MQVGTDTLVYMVYFCNENVAIILGYLKGDLLVAQHRLLHGDCSDNIRAYHHPGEDD